MEWGRERDAKTVRTLPVIWKATYPRPQRPRLALGRPLPGAENVVYPADAGVVDVTKSPYFAKGDGRTDDTLPIQKALDDHPSQGAIIYLPNGVYRITDTLHWPHGRNPGGEENETVLQGQSQDGTVLQLPDHCPGFDNPRRPKSPINTGRAPAQRFGNEIHNLTVDTGADNPGACGLQFIANNQGGVYDVTISSGDGQGVIGLDMGYTDEQGPCLVKNVLVRGFDVGIHVATPVASETMEHVTVEHQNKAGFRNDGQPCTVRDLQSLDAVPAFVAGGGFSVLDGARLRGFGAASTQPAIQAEAALSARGVMTSGCRLAVADRTAHLQDVAGPSVPLYLTRPAVSLFGPPSPPLRLPVRETPDIPWDDPSTWVAPQKYGAKADGDTDASAAIQQAIDSGATTVYLPRGGYKIGHTIFLRGNVRRLIGCKAYLMIAAPLNGKAQPLFRLANGASPSVTVEGINTDYSSGPYYFMDDPSPRTLVLRRLGINFQGADAFHGQGPGTVFLEDVVGRYFRFHGQTVWARQFNVEGDGLPDPMFVVDNAQASLAFSEVCYTGQPYDTIVRETHGGEAREMKKAAPEWGGLFTLFTSGAAPAH